jgi:glucokinase
MVGDSEFPVLVGDIGGTNSRFGLVRDIHSSLEFFDPVKTNDYSDLQSAIDDAVLSKTSIIPKRLVMGIAGPISGTQYQLTNARWNINPEEVMGDLALNSAEFMNDFPAQALGVLAIDRDSMLRIGGGTASKFGTRVVLGPGTSFGIATLVHTGRRWIIIPGEAACADLGLGSGRNQQFELGLQPHLTKTCGRLTVEDMITGSGLENLYQAVWLFKNVEGGIKPPAMSAAQISAAAGQKSDEVAIAAVALFSTLLGRVAGNIALTVAATGGVYVTGGMAHKMFDLIEQSEFRREFENKEPQNRLARAIPTYFVNREMAAVEGLANYVRTPDSYDLSLASAYFKK